MGTEVPDGAREAWPRWATEPVAVVPCEPAWLRIGAALAAEVGAALASLGVPRVHHVGSTAVPGLAAKPIVDLLAEVVGRPEDSPDRRLDDVAAQALSLLAPGAWHLVPPDLDQRPWRRLLVLVRDERRSAHLQLVASDHPRVGETVAFRDALRADPEAARRYGALKRLLAVEHASDREAYTDAKSAFVDELLERTRQHRDR